ncbi:MAG: hypothetical protein WDN26_03995 [Chitinophagaceae bacterium]
MCRVSEQEGSKDFQKKSYSSFFLEIFIIPAALLLSASLRRTLVLPVRYSAFAMLTIVNA